MSVNLILCLFGMASQGTIHLKNASFWRAEVLINEFWYRGAEPVVALLCLKFDVHGNWQPV